MARHFSEIFASFARTYANAMQRQCTGIGVALFSLVFADFCLNGSDRRLTSRSSGVRSSVRRPIRSERPTVKIDLARLNGSRGATRRVPGCVWVSVWVGARFSPVPGLSGGVFAPRSGVLGSC
jgi:hypothetical protein